MTVEVEGEPRAACVADTLSLFVAPRRELAAKGRRKRGVFTTDFPAPRPPQ